MRVISKYIFVLSHEAGEREELYLGGCHKYIRTINKVVLKETTQFNMRIPSLTISVLMKEAQPPPDPLPNSSLVVSKIGHPPWICDAICRIQETNLARDRIEIPMAFPPLCDRGAAIEPLSKGIGFLIMLPTYLESSGICKAKSHLQLTTTCPAPVRSSKVSHVRAQTWK